jgi:hypothetical protein
VTPWRDARLHRIGHASPQNAPSAQIRPSAALAQTDNTQRLEYGVFLPTVLSGWPFPGTSLGADAITPGTG